MITYYFGNEEELIKFNYEPTGDEVKSAIAEEYFERAFTADERKKISDDEKALIIKALKELAGDVDADEYDEIVEAYCYDAAYAAYENEKALRETHRYYANKRF